MRVCLILEGCYPYIRGGVSTWTHSYISSNPNIDFVLWTIHSSKKDTLKPMYTLPSNVVERHEIYLEDAFKLSKKCKKHDSKVYIDTLQTLCTLLQSSNNNAYSWDKIMNLCTQSSIQVSNLMMSEEFLQHTINFADTSNGTIGLSEAFYSLRSIYMPIVYLLSQNVPNADVYHSAVAGYGGVLGALAKYTTRKPFILTEHGIYPREREEELMQADWVIPSMRNAWINSFYNLSKLAYAYADRVTSLFESACYKQQEIGCDPSKCRIIPNGIDCSRFINIPIRDTSETINIGAFVRFAPIKDLKTLIYAFYNLHSRINTTKLFIMGGTDDPTYRDECLTLIKNLELDSVEVTGYIDTIEYMESMDFTVMSSISEGQPLAILESLASGRPCVTTNVGNCSELLCSEDGYGQAGIYCTPMDTVGLANAMELMCLNSNIRKMFGNNGKERIKNRYTHTQMIDSYLRVYDEVV